MDAKEKYMRRSNEGERYNMAVTYAQFKQSCNLFGNLSQYDLDLIDYILGIHSDTFYSEKMLKKFKRDINIIEEVLL